MERHFEHINYYHIKLYIYVYVFWWVFLAQTGFLLGNKIKKQVLLLFCLHEFTVGVAAHYDGLYRCFVSTFDVNVRDYSCSDPYSRYIFSLYLPNFVILFL